MLHDQILPIRDSGHLKVPLQSLVNRKIISRKELHKEGVYFKIDVHFQCFGSLKNAAYIKHSEIRMENAMRNAFIMMIH